MLDLLRNVAELLIATGFLVLLAFLLHGAWLIVGDKQRAWEERVAKKKKAKQDFEEAKLNAGIKRGEE